jgi:hypothetical protein
MEARAVTERQLPRQAVTVDPMTVDHLRMRLEVRV